MKLEQTDSGWYFIDGLEDGFELDSLPDVIREKLTELITYHDWVKDDYDFGASPSREILFDAVMDMNAAVGTMQIPLYELAEQLGESVETDRICFKELDHLVVWLGLELIQKATSSIYNAERGMTTLSIPIKGNNAAIVKLPCDLTDDEARRAIKTTLSTLTNYYDLSDNSAGE